MAVARKLAVILHRMWTTGRALPLDCGASPQLAACSLDRAPAQALPPWQRTVVPAGTGLGDRAIPSATRLLNALGTLRRRSPRRPWCGELVLDREENAAPGSVVCSSDRQDRKRSRPDRTSVPSCSAVSRPSLRWPLMKRPALTRLARVGVSHPAVGARESLRTKHWS